jgi:hypothetical protein
MIFPGYPFPVPGLRVVAIGHATVKRRLCLDMFSKTTVDLNASSPGYVDSMYQGHETSHYHDATSCAPFPDQSGVLQSQNPVALQTSV